MPGGAVWPIYHACAVDWGSLGDAPGVPRDRFTTPVQWIEGAWSVLGGSWVVLGDAMWPIYYACAVD